MAVSHGFTYVKLGLYVCLDLYTKLILYPDTYEAKYHKTTDPSNPYGL